LILIFLQIVLGVLSLMMLGIGLIFLIDSFESPSRLSVAVVFFTLGGGLIALIVNTRRKSRERSPQNVRKRILKAARYYGGELPRAALNSMAGKWEIYERELQRLINENVCRKKSRDDGEVYIFDSFVHKVSKTCPYCNSQFPIRDPIRKCPNCGGVLEIKKGEKNKS